MENIKKHFDYLCKKIGSRVFGSDAEKRTAEYIKRNFENYGLETEIQNFPVEKHNFSKFEVRKVTGKKEVKIDCLPFGFSSFTDIKGKYFDLEYLENITAQNIKKKNLKRKCVLLFDGFGEKLSDFKNFIRSGVSAVILIDNRYPVNWPISLNMPYFWKKYLKIPVVSIPYFEAVKLKKEKVKRVFIKINGKIEKSESQNVNFFK